MSSVCIRLVFSLVMILQCVDAGVIISVILRETGKPQLVNIYQYFRKEMLSRKMSGMRKFQAAESIQPTTVRWRCFKSTSSITYKASCWKFVSLQGQNDPPSNCVHDNYYNEWGHHRRPNVESYFPQQDCVSFSLLCSFLFSKMSLL